MRRYNVSVTANYQEAWVSITQNNKVLFLEHCEVLERNTLEGSLVVFSKALKYLESKTKYRDTVQVEVKTETLKGILERVKKLPKQGLENLYYMVLRQMEMLPVSYTFLKSYRPSVELLELTKKKENNEGFQSVDDMLKELVEV